MPISLKAPELRELKPHIMVFGVGGAGCNAVNNMIESGLPGVNFIVANTDAQALTASKAERIVQMGLQVTEGLGAGAQPEIGRAAAEEAIEEIRDHLAGAHMCFVTAGMGGGTGTGAAPIIAQTAREMGILTVGVVTKPFQFEGQRRMRVAEAGIAELIKCVDTLIVIPNQNLFRVANERTTFADAFSMADQVLYSGVASITDLMVKQGLVNLDFADVRSIMRDMGKAMMGTGEASGEQRALHAAEAAIANPLLDETSMKGARGLLISITGGADMTLYEVDEAASRIRQEVDDDANIILGATFDEALVGVIRVSVVATGIDRSALAERDLHAEARIAAVAEKLRAEAQAPRQISTPIQAPRMEAPIAPAPQPVSRPANEGGVHITRAPQAAAVTQPSLPFTPPAATQHEEVRVEPIPAPRAVVYTPPPEPEQMVTEAAEVHAGPFIPPEPEPIQRPKRIPTIDEFPPVIREQVERQKRPESRAETAAATTHRTLFEKLRGFAASRQQEPEEFSAPVAVQRPKAPEARMQPAMARPAPAPGAVHAQYAKAAAPPPAQPRQQTQLDLHGRPVPPQRQQEDDEFAIPAFLRRKTS